MWSHSSCETTENIRVTATSRCVGTSSSFSHFPSALDPRLKHYRPGTGSPPNFEDKHRFAYRIRIENISEEEHIQLLGRYWYIQEGEDDGSEETDDPVIVDAPKTGVVGQLPVLRPGQVFEYMSGADLESRKGSMVGHFYMVKTSEKALSAKSGDEIELKDGDKFEAVVAPFPLVAN
jgi:ApaG protein